MLLHNVITGVVVGMAVKTVVKHIVIKVKGIITKRRLKEELAKRSEEELKMAAKEALAAKIVKADEEGCTVTLDVFDRSGQSMAEISVTGDEIADDVSEGDVIELVA